MPRPRCGMSERSAVCRWDRLAMIRLCLSRRTSAKTKSQRLVVVGLKLRSKVGFAIGLTPSRVNSRAKRAWEKTCAACSRCRAVLVGAQRGWIDFAEPSCIGGIMVVAVQFRLPATDRAGVRWRFRREQGGDDSRAIGRHEPLRARRGGEWAWPDAAINRPNPPLDFLFFEWTRATTL
jgi:hypothetical protein